MMRCPPVLGGISFCRTEGIFLKNVRSGEGLKVVERVGRAK